MTHISDTSHMIEAPDLELLPAMAEVPAPDKTAEAEQIAAAWPESLQRLPRSINRAALGAGMLAMGAGGPPVAQEMLRAFNDHLTRTFSTTGSAVAAIAAGSLHTARGIQQRFASAEPE
jgi:hypothetical protein